MSLKIFLNNASVFTVVDPIFSTIETSRAYEVSVVRALVSRRLRHSVKPPNWMIGGSASTSRPNPILARRRLAPGANPKRHNDDNALSDQLPLDWYVEQT